MVKLGWIPKEPTALEQMRLVTWWSLIYIYSRPQLLVAALLKVKAQPGDAQ